MAYLSRPDGTILLYEDFNFAFPWEERGAPVVLVHGLGCNWTLWIKQLAWLVPSRRVIAVDARGSDQSRPAAQGWSTRDMTMIWGALDAIIPVQMGLAMHQALLRSTLRVVEGCGHFVNLEAPETFNAILAEVLGLPTPTSWAATSVSQPE